MVVKLNLVDWHVLYDDFFYCFERQGPPFVFEVDLLQCQKQSNQDVVKLKSINV